MAKEKACKECKGVYEGTKCPYCGASDGIDTFKGKVSILNPEESEIAKNLGIKKKGIYAVKLR
jgi:DNA-directed RNA polymerase subunit E"